MRRPSVWMLGVVLVVGFCQAVCTGAEKEILFTPETVQWGPGPASLSSGAQLAVLEGDPAKPGPFTIRLKFPAHFTVSPHWHPADEHVAVISGVLHLALGDKLDTATKEEKILPAGSFRVVPAGTHHFGWTTDEETILQLHGQGPWEVHYLNPSDDPRTGKK